MAWDPYIDIVPLKISTLDTMMVSLIINFESVKTKSIWPRRTPTSKVVSLIFTINNYVFCLSRIMN